VTAARRALLARAVRLERLTVGWTVAETLAALAAGLAAGSVALLTFGAQSLMEIAASAGVLWRLGHEQRRAGARRIARVERAVTRAVGWSLLALAAIVLYEATTALRRADRPARSYPGIALGVVALAAMSGLGLAKRRVGRALGSRAMVAESSETLICAYQSATLLAGLGAYAAWGWWWADPAAALLMVPVIVKEGWEAV